MSKWQPIETAPTDGTRILVWEGFYECVELVWWRWKQTGEEAYGTWTTNGISGYNPTHWMPLPDPPLDAEEKGKRR